MLFAVTYDRTTDYIEAATFADAVDVWRRFQVKQNSDMDFLEEHPESVVLLSKDDVVRDEPTRAI